MSIYIQLKPSNLRANGLPGKRAFVQLCDTLPKKIEVSRWEWLGMTVRLYTPPVHIKTYDDEHLKQYFVGAYIPAQFHSTSMLWVNQIWFEFNKLKLNQFLKEQSINVKDIDDWLIYFFNEAKPQN